MFVPGRGSASAATAASCSFAQAGTGTYAQTLCWFDLSGYDADEAMSPDGQQITVELPGGYTMNFTLAVSGSPASAAAFPTYGAAYLGQNGHYAGVSGRPALYQSSQSSVTTATLSDIAVTSPAGSTVTGYALVGADAESSDANESITWTSTVPIQSLSESIGNACGGGFTGVGTTTVTCVGRSTGIKTGTAILAAQDPQTFAQRMVGGGRQAVAFGVLISKVQLSKSVVRGFAGDRFSLTVNDSDGATIGRADTAGGTSATTGQLTVLTGASGADFTLAESATSGSLANYTQSWTCTRNGAADPSVPSASGAAATVHVDVGDFEHCTITNTGRQAAIALTKAAHASDTNGDGLIDAGDRITYTFIVTNTGELPLTAVAVHDAKVGPVTCSTRELRPAAATPCSATYTITDADQAAGAVDNTATASGVPQGTTATVASDPASTHTPVETPAPAIALTKTATPSTVDSAGDTVTYAFEVTNTGNVPLSDVAVDETAFSGNGTPPAVDCRGTLAAGAALACTATYTVTQADVDAGTITNTAVATGQPAAGGTVTSPPASALVTAEAAPAITLTKSADPATAHAAGDTVTYRFAVGNAGNVTLSGVGVDETAFSGTGTPPAVSCPSSTLAPDATMDCTATYTVTQDDVDAGTITNTAVATGRPPAGDAVSSDPASAEVTVPAAAAITLVKTPDPATVHAAGTTVTYTFTATNSGNVTLTDVVVDETAFSGSGTPPAITCPAATLAPGQDVTCTATYKVTQADIDAGTITNRATVTGTSPSGAAVSATADATVTAKAGPALTLAKKASPTTVTAAGQVVHYTFQVTNTGNTTVGSLHIEEGRFTGHGTISAISCPLTTLGPGAATTCAATYRAVRADLTGGPLRNTATAAGTTSGGLIGSNPSTATVAVRTPPPAPVLGDTGNDTGRQLLIGVLLVLGGAAALVVARRVAR